MREGDTILLKGRPYLVERKVYARPDGQSSFFKVKDVDTRKVWGLKTVYGDEEFLLETRHEAVTLIKLNSPRLPQVHDYGIDDQKFWMLTSYFEGTSLRDRINAIKGHELSRLDENLSLCIHICRAIEEIHKKDYYHRDLKPDNIMIEGGRVTPFSIKLIDFGLSARVHYSQEGDMNYWAPEQQHAVVNGVYQPIGPWVDIFSLGIICIEILAGKIPERYRYRESKDWVDFERPSEILPGFPKDLEAVLMKAVAHQRVERYSSVAEFRAELQRVKAQLSAFASKQVGARQEAVETTETEEFAENKRETDETSSIEASDSSDSVAFVNWAKTSKNDKFPLMLSPIELPDLSMSALPELNVDTRRFNSLPAVLLVVAITSLASLGAFRFWAHRQISKNSNVLPAMQQVQLLSEFTLSEDNEVTPSNTVKSNPSAIQVATQSVQPQVPEPSPPPAQQPASQPTIVQATDFREAQPALTEEKTTSGIDESQKPDSPEITPMTLTEEAVSIPEPEHAPVFEMPEPELVQEGEPVPNIDILVAQGESLERQGEYSGAVERYLGAIMIGSDDPNLYFRLAAVEYGRAVLNNDYAALVEAKKGFEFAKNLDADEICAELALRLVELAIAATNAKKADIQNIHDALREAREIITPGLEGDWLFILKLSSAYQSIIDGNKVLRSVYESNDSVLTMEQKSFLKQFANTTQCLLPPKELFSFLQL